MNKINKLNEGFTLIETLVAISIFTLAILALLIVLTQSIANNNYAKKKIAGTFLAQEGIEYIRNMRDTFVLYDPTDSQTGWNAFNTHVAGGTYPSGTTLCGAVNGCYFGDLTAADYSDTTEPMESLPITACNGTCPSLLYDDETGKYNYTSGASSGFVRKIFVSQVSSQQTRIFCTVSWTQGSGNFSLTFSEDLFNWIE